MTVAVGHQIGISGSSEHGQSQASTRGASKPQGVAWAGAPATISPSSFSAGAESFRSGLQSLLASLSANGNGLIQEEPAAEGIEVQAESAAAGLLSKATPQASPTAETPALSLLAARTLPSSPAPSATQLPAVSKQATIPPWLATSTPLPQIAPEPVAKAPTISLSASAAPSNRATSFEHSPKHKATLAVDLNPQAYAAGGNVLQAIVPAQITGAPIEIAALAAPSSPLANLAAAPPVTSKFDSLNQQAPRAAYQGEDAVSSSPARIQTSSAASEPVAAHSAQSTVFNDARRSTIETGDHATSMATVSQNVSSATASDLHLSTTTTAKAATDDAAPKPDVAVAGESNQASPVGSIGPAVATAKTIEHALDSATWATAASFHSGSQGSTVVPSTPSSKQVAIGTGNTASPAMAALNLPSSPSAPVRPATTGQPLILTNLPPSSDTTSPTQGDPAKSTALSSQARIPTQQRASGQEVATVAPPVAADWLGQTSAVQLAAVPLQPAQVAPTPPVLAKADISTGVGAQSGIRSQRSARAVTSVSQANSQANGQIAGQLTDSNSQMRGLAGPIAPTSLTGGVVAGSADSAAAPAVHETFTALDGATPNPSTTWTHAGTQQAEAGFHDPALGWVGVRADSASGVVHASLVPDSTDSALTLGGHVAGLNTYLAEQHTPVESLTVAAPESRSLPSGLASGMNQSGDQGMNQGTGQNSGQGSYSPPSSNSQQSTPAATGTASSIQAAPAGMPEPSISPIGLGSSHISVMA
jgi:hypothetical protein